MTSSHRTAVLALVRNDIRLFKADRRAVIIGIVVPILIAAFFGYVFGGSGSAENGKIPIVVVDEDQSEISRAISADFAKESMVSVESVDRATAEARVKAGKAQVAAIIPKDFGRQATTALFNRQNKPRVALLVDPSQSLSSRVVAGLFAQYGMQEITRVAFSGSAGPDALDEYVQRLEQAAAAHPELQDLKPLAQALQKTNARLQAQAPSATGLQSGLAIPYEVTTSNVTARADIPYNGYAHSFAGMTTQFLLLAGIDAGVLLLMTRERGIWQRLRSAPLSKAQYMVARASSTALISLFQMLVIYLVAIAVFGVRINGSAAGFVLMCVSLCLLNATFGLMLASVGRSVGATRGIAILVVLLLVMLGGAWVPSFVFPHWLQQTSLFVPTRWAVDGLDAMTWRGLPFKAAIMPCTVLILTALVCLGISVYRFRWDD